MTEPPAPPPVDNPIAVPFWEATAQRKLRLQYCPGCAAWQFYPRPYCVRCQADELEWRDTSGRGTVYSKTVVRRTMVPGFDAPYVVALVELDEGPRLLTNLVGDGAEIGDPVEVEWRKLGDRTYPVFRRASKVV